MRICLVYDCLYPHSVGGAERWYRNLAERLVAAGHEVDYVTLRQWPRGTDPGVSNVQVHAVGPRMGLYTDGRRRLAPPLVFGAGVLWHLLRNGRRYDVVHTASFPYFSLLAAGLAVRPGGYRIVVDWHEVWSRDYWISYAGSLAGRVGWAVQRACARVGQRAFCFSRLHAERLRDLGFPHEVSVLEGEYAGSLDRPPQTEREPVVMFAGRHIPEKRPTSLVRAFDVARRALPELRLEIYGDGPDREKVLGLVSELELDDVAQVPGIVDGDVIESAFRRAAVHVLPSLREGYGLVVVEAAAAGTPSIVVQGLDNASTELIEEGVNGYVAASAEPEKLGAAIVKAIQAGEALRGSTADWFERNGHRLSIDTSLETVVRSYET